MKSILVSICLGLILAVASVSSFAGEAYARKEKPVVIPYSKIIDSTAYALAAYTGQKCSEIRDVGCDSLSGSRYDSICDRLTRISDGGKSVEIKHYLYARLTQGNAPACE